MDLLDIRLTRSKVPVDKTGEDTRSAYQALRDQRDLSQFKSVAPDDQPGLTRKGPPEFAIAGDRRGFQQNHAVMDAFAIARLEVANTARLREEIERFIGTLGERHRIVVEHRRRHIAVVVTVDRDASRRNIPR
jgi:hypothetical protein